MTWVSRRTNTPHVTYGACNTDCITCAGLRRRIELLQDFSMPVAATGLQVTSDGQYILASGQSEPAAHGSDWFDGVWLVGVQECTSLGSGAMMYTNSL